MSTQRKCECNMCAMFGRSLWLGLATLTISVSSFAVTGMTRVAGECHNVSDPKFKTHFELDARNEQTNEDNVLGHTDAGALRVKMMLWGGAAASEYASSINFRLELNALREKVGNDPDHSIAQVFRPIEHRHFSFTKQQAEAGAAWNAELRGEGYAIDCSGTARFEKATKYVDLTKLEPVALDLDTTRMTFSSGFIPEGRELCGVKLTSVAASIEEQQRVLNWLWITNGSYGHRFDTISATVHPIRENIRLGKGQPSLRLQYPGYTRIGGGGALVWETSAREAGRKPTLAKALLGSGNSMTPELLATLRAQAIVCDPE